MTARTSRRCGGSIPAPGKLNTTTNDNDDNQHNDHNNNNHTNNEHIDNGYNKTHKIPTPGKMKAVSVTGGTGTFSSFSGGGLSQSPCRL